MAAACWVLVAFLWVQCSSAACSLPAPRIGVVSKIIVDSVAGGAKRLGGGGVQAAVGTRLAVPAASVSFIAPAGTDFDTAMLDGLRERGVDADGVRILSHVPVTPGQKIDYDSTGTALWQNYGWESWDELCDWVPALGGGQFDVIHAIVEGPGRGEVEAAGAWLEEATASWCALRSTRLPGRAARPPVLSLEPVMHSVNSENIARLTRITPMATCVSPDLLTAARIARIHDRKSPPPMSVAHVSRSNASLFEIARACSDALKLQEDAILAIRDGGHGSYIYRVGAGGGAGGGNSSSNQSTRGTLSRVAAVAGLDVLDPTGAGNAYAAALAAQLACEASPAAASVAAAKVASAAGAAFCATEEWAPPDVKATAAWVASRATSLRVSLIPETNS